MSYIVKVFILLELSTDEKIGIPVVAVCVIGGLFSSIGINLVRNMCGIESPRAQAARRQAEEQERLNEETHRAQARLLTQIQQGRRDSPPTYDELFVPPPSARPPSPPAPPAPPPPTVPPSQNVVSL